jgi:hypothetical protein
MLQADSYQFNFPTPPALAEFVPELLLGWFIALKFIAVGVYALHRRKTIWIKLAALLAVVVGAAFCFLLGFSFTPVNHHRYAWSCNRDINYWVNWAVVLAFWGLSPLLFRTVRKSAKRGGKQTESNAN